ncbi:MAG: cytidylate kinase-like family protein [Planctomycetota bacterium]|jgi:cytidylate kinase
MIDPTDLSEACDMSDDFLAPQHGTRGEPTVAASLPRGLSIALSREAGSRGSSIARRVSARMGWDIYTQEMIEVLAQESALNREIANELPEGAAEWVHEHLQQLLQEQSISRNPQVMELARVIALLGVQGEVVLLGRGAGCVLPPASTLHVRLVAPLHDRVAYMGQCLRLTEEEADDQVRRRDQRRAEFLSTHFHRKPSDMHQYDMVLNTSFLGEETCADLIVQAAKAKMNAGYSGDE